MLKIGTKAKDFTLKNQNGEDITLSSFLGKKVVLYFYPKDNTSGCTAQAIGFSQLKDEFKNKNAVIIGISKDTEKSHLNFATKYNLNFNLLADPELLVIKEYDVWHEKKLYGKTYFGIVRTTYIIDEFGTIIDAQEKVNASTNPKDTICRL